jgi:hypothetical protein
MRRIPALLVFALFTAVSARAEATRTLRFEYAGDVSRAFRVENLAGEMTVRPGNGPRVVVVATVRAADPALADLVRLEQVRDRKSGEPSVRVIYPIDRHTSYRYPRLGGADGGFLSRMFGGQNNVEYDGARVSVSGSRGVELYADVVVELPRGASTTFRNVVGTLNGSRVEGRLRFDTGSGDISLSDVAGEIAADTGSGDVSAEAVRGSFNCDTGSGDCNLTRFSGTSIDLDTGSGNVRVTESRADRVSADTGSGDVFLDVDDAAEVDADTGSGDVEIVAAGTRLSRITADTGSGDVSLKIASGIGFEMRTDVGSGDVDSDFSDAQPIIERRRVKGYRRGDERVKIDVDTGSGDVRVGPAR